MLDFGHSSPCKRLLAAFLILSIAACGASSSWEDIPVLETSSGEIRAGDAVRIEPSEFSPVEIAGTEFSVTKFQFDAIREQATVDLELLPTVTVMASKGDFHSVETVSEEAVQWPAGEPRKAITFSFLNMPDRSAYSGRGHLHFYLTDQDKNCVSNIVAWPVDFTK